MLAKLSKPFAAEYPKYITPFELLQIEYTQIIVNSCYVQELDSCLKQGSCTVTQNCLMRIPYIFLEGKSQSNWATVP